VEIWNDHLDDVDVLAERLRETEALVLIRERTRISATLLEGLPKLRLGIRNPILGYLRPNHGLGRVRRVSK